jgi:hypothetical protein
MQAESKWDSKMRVIFFCHRCFLCRAINKGPMTAYFIFLKGKRIPWLVVHFIFFTSELSTLLFCFTRIKIKLKCRHVDTIKAIETESQAVLNTLTKQDFQNAFKKWQALGTVDVSWRGLLLGWWWLTSPKLVFGYMAAPVLEIMDGSLYKTPRYVNFSRLLSLKYSPQYQIFKTSITTFFCCCDRASFPSVQNT